MTTTENPHIDRQRRQYTKEQDFEAGATVAPRNGGAGRFDVEPYSDAVRAGYIVGYGDGYQTIEDPSDHGTDDEAIQAVIDDMQAEGVHGRVNIPQGLLIESTVNFDGDQGSNVTPWGPLSFGRNVDYIDTSISDGSPIFSISNMNLQGQPVGMLNIAGTTSTEAAAYKFKDVSRVIFTGGDIRALGTGAADGAIVIDSNVYNSEFCWFSYNGRGADASTPDVSDVDVIRFLNSDGGGSSTSPGECRFYGFSTYAAPSNPFGTFMADRGASMTNLQVGPGRAEGAGGEALFYHESGTSRFDHVQLGRTETGAHGIEHSGFGCIISPTVYGSVDGTAVRIGAYGGCWAIVLDGDGTPGAIETLPIGTANPTVVPQSDVVFGSTDYSAGGQTWQQDYTLL